jgi:hypothetical protein
LAAQLFINLNRKKKQKKNKKTELELKCENKISAHYNAHMDFFYFIAIVELMGKRFLQTTKQQSYLGHETIVFIIKNKKSIVYSREEKNKLDNLHIGWES